jgi:hypothetical protein
MVRSAILITAATLVLSSAIVTAQQEPSAREEAANPVLGPSAEALAMRETLATTLDGAVTFQKSIPAPPTGTWGIISKGTGGGGIFRDSDSDAEVWLGSSSTGVTGYGSISGGYFESSIDSGFARLGHGDWGIGAGGNFTGGYFADTDGTGYAWLGYDRPSGTDLGGDANAGEYGVYSGGYAGAYFEGGVGTTYAYLGRGGSGIDAYGTNEGGNFVNTSGSGRAYLADQHLGLRAEGNLGGAIFSDANGSGKAYIAHDRIAGNTDKGGLANDGEYGVYAMGNHAGSYFEDTNDSAYAYVAHGTEGIKAYGSETGGYFKDTNSSGTGYVGRGHLGIWAFGDTAGGWFENTVGPGRARVAYYRPDGMTDKGGDANDGEYGLYAEGEAAGGYFEDADNSGYAYVAAIHFGIIGHGDNAGAYFGDSDSAGHAFVGSGSHKILGGGAVSFVQNHPYDSRSVIIYAAPEGDEVATYTRGTGRLVNGEATLPLGETFRWVTNPDIGLTAHLTPRGEPVPLAVVELSTDSMTVRGGAGAPDGLLFDYVVFGLRIGFEETSVVQEKKMEAYIPSMASHRELYQRRPDLRRFNSLERFKTMRHAAGEEKMIELSGAHALRDAIIEFDPAVHELPRPPGFDEPRGHEVVDGAEGHRLEEQGEERLQTVQADRRERRVPDHAGIGVTGPTNGDTDVYAPSTQSSSRRVVDLVDVSEVVEAGDVLVIGRDPTGAMRKGFEGHDPGVVGVVTASPVDVRGSQSLAPTDGDTGEESVLHAEVAFAGVVSCKVDAGYGAIWPSDLLVTSATPGHAMRTGSPLPGTIIGKALETLEEGTGTIRVLVMLR